MRSLLLLAVAACHDVDPRPEGVEPDLAFEVPVVIAAGFSTVNGESGWAPIHLARGGHSAYLGSGPLVAPVVPGVYDLLYRAPADSNGWLPQNQKARLARDVLVDGTRWLAVDVPAVNVYARVTVDGEEIPSCPIVLTTPDGDEVPLQTGWNRVIPGNYDVEYRDTGEPGLPIGMGNVLRDGVAVGERTVLDVEIPVASLTLAPEGLVAGDVIFLESNGDFAVLPYVGGGFTLRVVPDRYDVLVGDFAGGRPFLVTAGVDVVDGTHLDVAPVRHQVSLADGAADYLTLVGQGGSTWLPPAKRVPAGSYQVELQTTSGVQQRRQVVVDGDRVFPGDMDLVPVTFVLSGDTVGQWTLRLESAEASAQVRGDGPLLTTAVPPGRYRALLSYTAADGRPRNHEALVDPDLHLEAGAEVTIPLRGTDVSFPVRFTGPARPASTSSWSVVLEGRGDLGDLFLQPDQLGYVGGRALPGTYDVFLQTGWRAPVANGRVPLGCLTVGPPP